MNTLKQLGKIFLFFRGIFILAGFAVCLMIPFEKTINWDFLVILWGVLLFSVPLGSAVENMLGKTGNFLLSSKGGLLCALVPLVLVLSLQYIMFAPVNAPFIYMKNGLPSLTFYAGLIGAQLFVMLALYLSANMFFNHFCLPRYALYQKRKEAAEIESLRNMLVERVLELIPSLPSCELAVAMANLTAERLDTVYEDTVRLQYLVYKLERLMDVEEKRHAAVEEVRDVVGQIWDLLPIECTTDLPATFVPEK